MGGVAVSLVGGEFGLVFVVAIGLVVVIVVLVDAFAAELVVVSLVLMGVVAVGLVGGEFAMVWFLSLLVGW